jgi:polyisoprenoid-binding protein YceI
MKLAKAGLALLLLPVASFAAAPTTWKIVPMQSNITFTAVQNGAPVVGRFQTFTGDIQGNPANLTKDSHVKIAVDLGSVKTAYGAVETTLKTADWFDVAHFPQAVFTADNFTKTGKNIYTANGKLTIRNKTMPIILNIVMEKATSSEFDAKGSAMLKRTQFGVGQGQWSKTDSIKDEVQVEFTLKALKS